MNSKGRSSVILRMAWFAFGIMAAGTALSTLAADITAGLHAGWSQSYDAGYLDCNGRYAGGSEIMHLTPHQGKLYAANAYWKDSRWEGRPYASRQSAQVLRLDSADSRWLLDLNMGESNDLGLRYMKGNILKSVTFSLDASGKPLPVPQNVLVMAAGAYKEGKSFVSAWVRDDAKGKWIHSIVKYGYWQQGVRWVPRDMEVYRDKVTGVERLFLLLGNPGIISGVYDASLPSKIRWDEKIEFPNTGDFRARPLGIVQANGSLLVSVGGVIYRRVDGPKARYVEILNLGEDVNTDVGGIRGLTAIANPSGEGESLLFLWAPNGRSAGQIKRLDPDGLGGYTVHDEVKLRDLMHEKLGVEVGFVLGAHSEMYPIIHPVTSETLHLIGFQGILRGKENLQWNGSRLYAGAMYAIRAADGSYTVHEVNGPYAPGRPILVSPRTFARSPFSDDRFFVGGHDSSNLRSDDMAWIFKASVNTILGLDENAQTNDHLPH